MLPLDDPRWRTYHGGYDRSLYDASPLARQLLKKGLSEDFWRACWDDLHHQGDIGEAAYALVPYLVDYFVRSNDADAMLAGFVQCVEGCRLSQFADNPPLPLELERYYFASLDLFLTHALTLNQRWGEDFLRYYCALLALRHGHTVLGETYPDFTSAEAQSWFDGEISSGS
jgi:hypothetical protein